MEQTHFESLYPDTSRFAEIEKLLKFVKEGNSSQLVGLPGVGRSNLLGFLSYNRGIREKHLEENQKWFHFVLCNFSEVRKKPLLDAIKFIFLSLVESLRERKMSEFERVDKIFSQSTTTADEMVLFNGLKQAIDFLSIEKELTVVFLFDRFEEYVPMITPEFFTNLRSLRNRAKYRFSVVFSLNRELEELIEPTLFADFHEFLADNIIYLPLLDKPGLDFRISYLEKVSGKKLGKEKVEEVIKLTGGHGKLTRLCLEATLPASISQLTTYNTDDLKSYLSEQKSIKGALYEIWSSLLPEEQKFLAGLNTSEVTEWAPQRWMLEKLGLVGLVKDNKVTIPLFEKFITTLLRQDFGRAQRLTFDPKTNEIKRGDITLSESLTSSEFKLLKFLLENKDKVIQRDKIIQAVWKEDKTTAGVTDQAIDQLIFRLRKKIEKDPNNPMHLQTIKGRGIRFINDVKR